MDSRAKNQLIPVLQKVELDLGSSLKYLRFNERNPDSKAYWHYHPEVELVFIESGFGNRYVGNHISKFEDGDLILLGPNIPHLGYEFGLQGINEEVVVQFKKDLIKTSVEFMPELELIAALINKAKSGLSFYGETKKLVGSELIQMENKSPFDRLTSIFKILQILAQSEDYEVLNADGITLVIQNQNDDRINKVFQYVKDNYETEITLEQISQVALMTVPSFCRYFKKNTKKTFTQFVNDFRIRQAIRLIAIGDKSISEIANEVGYNNFSHFNTQFKRVTGETPSKYKKTMYQVIR